MHGALELGRKVHEWYATGYDLLLTPTLGEPPLPLGSLQTPDDPMAGFIRAGTFVPFTPPGNMTGQPAISLPLSWNSENLPIGSHLVAEYGREDLLLRVAAQLEAARPWAHRIPPTHA
jgi:amidase